MHPVEQDATNDLPKKKATTSPQQVRELWPDGTGIGWKPLFDTEKIQTFMNNNKLKEGFIPSVQVGGFCAQVVYRCEFMAYMACSFDFHLSGQERTGCQSQQGE
jgi:hypothetical protein